MHVNQSQLRQVVVVFRLDASVQTSSPLPDCRVKSLAGQVEVRPMQAQSLKYLIYTSMRHNALMQ